jgi:hypothetical protein
MTAQKWYAKTDADTVVASGDTMDACSAAARAVMGEWQGPPPYYLTTIAPGATPKSGDVRGVMQRMTFVVGAQ